MDSYNLNIMDNIYSVFLELEIFIFGKINLVIKD